MSRLVRPERVAEHLNVSKRRVYQLVREGELEGIRVGRRQLRIREDSLQRLTRGNNRRDG